MNFELKSVYKIPLQPPSVTRTQSFSVRVVSVLTRRTCVITSTPRTVETGRTRNTALTGYMSTQDKVSTLIRNFILSTDPPKKPKNGEKKMEKKK